MAEGTLGVGNFSPAQDDRLKVFISYSRDDLDFADQLGAGLEVCGFDATIDRHEITGGEAWRERLSGLIRDADTVLFVLSPKSAASEICGWEVSEAAIHNKRILPIVCTPLDDVAPPPQLRDLNYIFFYREAKAPGSGFGSGLAQTVAALNSDIGWIREHTRLLARATEWAKGGRPVNRLLSGGDIVDAKAWAARRPKDAPALTALHLEFIRSSEDEETSRGNVERARLEEMAAAQDARAQALHDKEQEQRRRKKTMNYAMTGACVFIAALAGALVYALDQSQKARKSLRETRVLQAGTFMSAANRLIEGGDWATQMLLALEVAPRSDSKETENWPYLRNIADTLQTGLEANREIAVLKGQASFSPDGKHLLISGQNSAPRLYSANDGKELRHFGDQKNANDAVLSLDGSRVLTHARDGAPQIWDVETGSAMATLAPPERGVVDVQFSPDDSTVAMAEASGFAEVWDASTGAKLQTLSAGDNDESGFFGASSLSFAPDGARLLMTSGFFAENASAKAPGQASGRLISIWNPATGEKIFEAGSRAELTVRNASFSPGGRFLMLQERTGFRLIDSQSGQEKFKTEAADDAHVMAEFSDDDARLLTTSRSGRARIWDSQREDEPRATLGAHEKAVSFAAFSPDSKSVLTVSADKAVLWDSATGAIVHSFPVGRSPIEKAIFSSDGQLLMATYKDQPPRIWNTSTWRAGTAGRSSVPDASFSPDGKWVLTRSTGTNVKIWPTKPLLDPPKDDVPSTRDIVLKSEMLGGHEDQISEAVFNPDPEKRPVLLTVTEQGVSRLWRSDYGKLIDSDRRVAGIGRHRVIAPQESMTQEKLRVKTSLAAEQAQKAVARCLSIEQRLEYALDPEPPKWCLGDSSKHPYNDESWKDWLRDRKANDPYAAAKLSFAAGSALTDGDDSRAAALSELSLRLDGGSNWLLVNRAHALMYTGDTEGAKRVYLENYGKDVPKFKKSWQDLLITDFADLRKSGRGTPLMDEVEAEFKKKALAAVVAPLPASPAAAATTSSPTTSP
ncbi:MAG: toll/interleukin-1 receptor domain-containing protein [Hyphomicrobium sp.]